MAWSGSEFEESMPNTRTQTNMHSGLTSCVYYMPDRTYAQLNWQLGVSVLMYSLRFTSFPPNDTIWCLHGLSLWDSSIACSQWLVRHSLTLFHPTVSLHKPMGIYMGSLILSNIRTLVHNFCFVWLFLMGRKELVTAVLNMSGSRSGQSFQRQTSL